MCALESVSNNKIKELVKLHQKKYRDLTGLFIAEGQKCVEELIENNISVVDIFVDEKSTSINKLKNKVDSNLLHITNEQVMKKIATTDSPCEVLAVAHKRIFDIKNFVQKQHLILLDRISDPGNLGTIIRSAAAFNIEGIILFGDCVDIYSPKVIRSTAGNLFKTPFVSIKDVNELNKYFKDFNKIATSLSDKNNISLKEASVLDKYIVLFGSEALGLSKELTGISDYNIRLNMSKNVESLNLSISASIIMYELFN